jgi:glutamate 5-kinase
MTPRYKRLVVKLGTSVLTAGTPHLSPRRLLEIVRQVARLHERGVEVIIATSGSIAAGRDQLGNPDLGRNIPAKQMLAAVGQPRLMHTYADLFAIFDIDVAQILLTRSDFSNRQRYLNARDTLGALLAQRVIPIVNENDTIATDEIKLGDNDNLSALVANLIDADLLAMLTDQPGLFTGDPRTDPQAELIHAVEAIDDVLWEAAGGAGTALGTGGMVTKLQAAQLAVRSGVTVVIAQGTRPDVLLELVGPDGEATGTWFHPATSHIESRKRWMLSEQPQGRVKVDAGAARTLRQGGASLLPVGMVGVEGEFERGVVVSVTGPDGHEIARGLANYSADELSRICRAHSTEIAARLGYTAGDEVIHRDHLVLV